ncbi:A disintegrin and metalloproteinase with thrombospondin motifs 6-like isoform X2 [Dendronephthya gigantea]|uniref:A disintegrin and metalloproteinase with thrombospondin motifs 6-like isoform X2 n=1 Tax=Dendronephthya gigantea TaxID=151771 RepID=UPI001069CC26|nr:A disintegrin and metalloproteinase with thrombospondin motifs 6-like isoform X2 [Dendronephthya gigantea]
MGVLVVPLASLTLLMLFLDCTMSANMGKQKKSHDIHLKMNSVELKRYFGASSLTNVPEYDITFPKHANEKGQQISSHRAKRGTRATGLKYYHLNAFDKDLRLKVSLNKRLLGPAFHVEIRHKDGSKTINDAPHRNFYHGHVIDHPGSFVALSDHRGVSGALRLVDDEMLFIEPIPRHLLEQDHDDDSIPHLVIKKNDKDFKKDNKVMFDTRDNLPRDETLLGEREFRNKDEIDDDENGHRFYEIIYVGDHLITEHIPLKELPDMLLIIANIVSRMFTDSSFGDIKLHYVVTKILILNNGELNYTRKASNGVKIDHFGSWLQANNPQSDEDPQHVDAGTLFTSHTGGGLALSGGMCYWRSMPSIVGHIGLSSSVIAAHENFHNLGGGHDPGTDECPNGANIMSTYVPSGKACFTWSKCSRRWVQDYLRSGRSFCMKDAPTLKPPAIPPYMKNNLPGSIFDGHKQCQYSLGTSKARQCASTCGPLYCDDGGGCWWRGGAPAEGTSCGKDKWCIRGECVDNGSPSINGNWGSWSEYTQCSRSCGVGIQYRSRKCDNPSPKRHGEPCKDPSKDKEERTCNKQACPGDSKPFRDMQCKSAVNVNYTHYIRPGAECWRWCRHISSSGASLHGQVTDGTRCYGDDDNNPDICVQGECEHLGCDKELNGDELDRCGVCAGDGSTCEPEMTNYTKIHLSWGFDNADTMVILKKGYSNVHAKMNGANWNMIGIQDMNGEYIIKLPSWTKTTERSGMKITYVRRSNTYQDEIIIPGLVTEDLKLVFVHIRGRNEGVVIRYSVPVENPAKPSPDIFRWKIGLWSTCSKTCAGGMSTRDVTCSREDDNTRVGMSNCPSNAKPAVDQVCNAHDCPPEWHSYLTACTKTCGKGSQHRKIECRRLTTEHFRVVDDTECAGPRPTAEKPDFVHCNEIACPPSYKPGPWSKCSTICGQGVMTRSLKCEMINDQGEIASLPMHVCEQYRIVKPPTEGNCNFDSPCVALPKYSPLGCFKDKFVGRTLPQYLKNLRPQIDWQNMDATIIACAKLAQEHKVEYFAVQYYGECWAVKPGIVPNYDKYGPAGNCWSGVGGPWSNYVYKMVMN